jgi:hypothetical protein
MEVAWQMLIISNMKSFPSVLVLLNWRVFSALSNEGWQHGFAAMAWFPRVEADTCRSSKKTRIGAAMVKKTIFALVVVMMATSLMPSEGIVMVVAIIMVVVAIIMVAIIMDIIMMRGYGG